jgi:hypothetical protein
MKFEIENGSFSGSAEWRAPGDVMVQMPDEQQQAWFENYFRAEDSFMGGSVECGEMQMERRDESAEAFTRAARELAAFSYKVRQGEARRYGSHGKK